MLQDKSSSSSVKDIFTGAAKGAITATVFAAVLLTSLAAIIYGTSDPGALTDISGRIAVFVVAAAAGIFSARFSSTDPKSVAATCFVAGVFFLIVLLGMSMIPENSVTSTLSPGIKIALYLMIPVISALTGVSTRKRPRRHKNLRRRRR